MNEIAHRPHNTRIISAPFSPSHLLDHTQSILAAMLNLLGSSNNMFVERWATTTIVNSDAEIRGHLHQLVLHLPGSDAGCGTSCIDLYVPE